jgi:hypothetical protein
MDSYLAFAHFDAIQDLSPSVLRVPRFARLRLERESDEVAFSSSFVTDPVGLACSLDMCESEFAKVHARDENLVRADDIQQP